MPKDIREILKDVEHNQLKLPKDHRKRFEDRLSELHKPKKRNNFFFLKVAASLIVLVSLGYFALNINSTVTQTEETPEIKFASLGSISPEMQKVENYYLAAINYEIASLEETPENKKILEDYLEKIGKLDEDYKRLNEELAEKGINEKTINSLITNLQFRLQLLLQLKDQLNELKTSNSIKNEDSTI